MTIHEESSTLRNMKMKVKDFVPEIGCHEIIIEDWWDIVYGDSWMYADGNPAAIKYAIFSSLSIPPTPIDNDVLYGKVNGLGYLVHSSWLVKE